jgi:hypothetical protein
MIVTLTLALSSCAAAPLGLSDETPSPAHTPLSEQQQRDKLWHELTREYPEAKQPEVEFVRHLQQDEWATVQSGCMAEQGFPDVKPTPDGGLSFGDVPDSQGEAFWTSRYICFLKFPLDPKYSGPLTEDRLKVLYDYYVSSLIPCLEAEGYAISDPPSKSVFIDQYQEASWSPYLDAMNPSSQQEWYRINAACPQWPVDFYG